MNGPFSRFLIRWLVGILGIWAAAGLLGDLVSYDNRVGAVVVAGLLLAIVNVFIKPILVVLALPALFFTLGLFMVVINGLMVLLVSKLYAPLHVESFWAAILAGIVIGLVNYLVTAILEDRKT
ncbi:MAG TPA: phage holin family protein [Candidatus Limnocylindrales bacterium]|nr:phage holin family protein [Candidatus Limnocylindrales bacterium]